MTCDRRSQQLLSALTVALTSFAAHATASAQVVPSGTTATSVTAGANGQTNVAIAPANANSVSVNQYQAFSVQAAGVNLINQGVNATTIINQVTSANRSYLYGPLAVVGPTAHVVVANPNGITVDGGSFINTGGVALSAGPVNFVGSATATGYQDTVLGTGSGDIQVVGAGLTGSMTSLQLIAGKIKIDGPIVNTSPDPNADINLVAGNASVTLSSSAIPGSTLKPWASTSTNGGSSTDILIDVTPNGSLSASRISMLIGGQGAGVSFQGRGTASIGEFAINAKGQVKILGGQIQAERDVKIAAAEISVLNAGTRTAKIASISGGVTLLANAGDIDITGQITGVTRNAGDPASRGAVTLDASGSISLLTENAGQLAIVFASHDDLSVTAGGDITNNTGRLLSNNRTFVSAGGTFRNVVDVVGAANGGEPIITTTGRRFWWWPWQGRTIQTVTYNGGSLRVPEQLAYVVGSSVFINAANVTNSGSILAQSGALLIDTGLFEDIGLVTGSASFTRSCFFFCSSSGTSNVAAASVNGNPAGLVSSAGAMAINASTGIVNNGGVILSEGNLALNSPSIAAASVFAMQVAGFPGGIYNAFSGPTYFVYYAPTGGLFEAPNGSIDVTTSAPVKINGGALQAGTGVDNPAGTDVIAAAQPKSELYRQQIGLFRGLW